MALEKEKEEKKEYFEHLTEKEEKKEYFEHLKEKEEKKDCLMASFSDGDEDKGDLSELVNLAIELCDQ